MSESKKSRKAKRRWARAVEAYQATRFGCWERTGDTVSRMSHTCVVTDSLHTGPHLCCCGYQWETNE